MTPDEVGGLLRFAASLDPWLKQTNPEEGAVMVMGWGDMLAPVAPDVAMGYVRRHYSIPNARTLQPGDILGAWREHLQADAQVGVVEDARAPRTPQQGLGVYLRRCLEAVAAGGRVEDVPVPSGSGLTESADRWARRCAFPTICACSHTECRGGWLDVETTVVNGLGDTYPAVRRCHICADGLLMAEEKGIARKPSKTHAGGRR